MASQGLDSNNKLEKNFWKKLDTKVSEDLNTLNEMMGAVLKMKVKCAKLQLQLNQLYSAEHLQELLQCEETEEDKEIKRYMEMIEKINEHSTPNGQHD